MNKWSDKPISSLGRIVTGKTPSKAEPEYWDGDELFVSPKDMERDSFYIRTTQANITKKALTKFKSQRLPKNAVMYTSLSYGFGKIGVATKDLLTNQQITSVISNTDNDFRFIYYLLRVSTPHIFSYNSGIDTPIVPKSVFEKIQLPIPPLPIQRKIAAILSAYDELIENNNRRIVILEKMAEEIYREWFVRLRFPGHKKVKVVKGVPEGWEVKESEEVFSFVKGLSYKSDEISDEKGEHYFITLKSFNRGGGYRSNGLKYYTGKFNARQIVRPYDIVMAVTDMTQDRAVVGRIARVPETGIDQYLISTDVIKIVPKTVSADFLYAAIRFSGFSEMLKEFANGANVLHLNTTAMKRLKMLIPTNDLIQTFTQRLRPIFELSDNLASKNTILKSTRDLLLPRLISGKLDVENLDIAFPPGMEEERS